MATIQERLATRMRWWADEGNLGYDWDYPDRWHFWVGGEVDCSSMVISVCRECGLDVGDATYTGNMRAEFTAHHWEWIQWWKINGYGDMNPGDVLLRETTHTAMVVAYGLMSQASANEWGGASGGQSGDQGRPNGIGETNTVAINMSYPWDGILRYVGPDPEPEVVRNSERPTGTEDGGQAGPVWRLYNPHTGEHHWTQARSEYDTLCDLGWKGEGVAFTVGATGERVYRMYNPHDGQHLFTRSLNEAQVLWDAGWDFEGVAWRSSGDVPIWRIYNPFADVGQHHYTASNLEHARLVDGGWKQEGVAFWAEAA